VINIKKFLQIHVLHVKKPLSQKFNQFGELFENSSFFTPMGSKTQIIKMFTKMAEFLYLGFSIEEHESGGIFDFDYWKVPKLLEFP
jgi:hypothetical protein